MQSNGMEGSSDDSVAQAYQVVVKAITDGGDGEDFKELWGKVGSRELLAYTGDAPLLIRARKCAKITAFLLRQPHVIVDIEDKWQQTALMLAADEDADEVAQMLLEAGADVLHQNDDGDTALSLAAYSSCNKTLPILLRFGADPFQKTNTGDTPMSDATSRDNVEGLRLMRQEVRRRACVTSAQKYAFLLCRKREGTPIHALLPDLARLIVQEYFTAPPYIPMSTVDTSAWESFHITDTSTTEE